MIKAISTHEVTQTFDQVMPALKTACTIVGIVSIMSTNASMIEIPRNDGTSTPLAISTPSVLDPRYNGNIILTWEGVSIMTSKVAESLSRIDQIKELGNNWNGNGATAFSKELLAKARELVTLLAEQPAIFPTGRDSIQLEYEKQNGDYLEFELFEGGRLKMFSYTHDGISETKDVSFDEANKVVCAFYGLQV